VLRGNAVFAEWDECEKDEETVILDVREEQELKMFDFEKSLNIPLSELRNRVNELDKNRKYVIFCAIGVRAYNAFRLLQQNGFENIKIYPAGTRFYISTHSNNETSAKDVVCKFN
ncbi:MAG: pyridine nucleotide-disulfide oxidoreductase, partial [Lachnospiraceae bacterium]|nr:pyridine nucleotide-disulfide oxidoreductase [Lachnospiraceae bacterium]